MNIVPLAMNSIASQPSMDMISSSIAPNIASMKHMTTAALSMLHKPHTIDFISGKVPVLPVSWKRL